MPLVIDDDTLAALGMTADEARVEVAVRLFDADKLGTKHAAELAGMDRLDFWMECGRRGVPVFRYSIEEVERELALMEEMRSGSATRAGPGREPDPTGRTAP